MESNIKPRSLEVNLSNLSPNQREVINILKKVGEEIHQMWLRQNDPESLWCNCYQKGLTKKEIAKAAEDNPEIRSPYTVVIKDENGDIKPVPYNEYCKESFDKLTKLLMKAATKTDDPNLAIYLKKLSDAYKRGDFVKALLAYVTKPETKIDILMGPISSYQDKLFGVKKTFQFNLRVLREPETESIHEMLDIVKNVSIVKPTNTIAHKLESHKVNASVYDVLMFAGRQSTSQPSSTNLPNEEELIEKYGTKIIFYKNAMDDKCDRLINDYGKYLDHKTNTDDETFYKSYLRLIAYHEISEATIKFPNMEKRLKGCYDYIKEINAFAHGFRSAGLHLLNGFLTMEEYQRLIIMLIFYGLDTIKRRSDPSTLEYAKGFAVVLNYAINAGSLSIENNKIKINFNKISESSEIARIIYHLLAEGTEEQAAELLEKYGDYSRFDNLLKS